MSIDSAAPLEKAHTLDTRLVTPVGLETPISKAQQLCLDVVAPTTLSERYTFEAELNSQASFTVKAPVSGMEEGQKNPVPFPSRLEEVEVPRVSRPVPVGHWKASLILL